MDAKFNCPHALADGNQWVSEQFLNSTSAHHTLFSATMLELGSNQISEN